MPSIWDDFARGYDAGTSLGDKVVRRSSSKKARKLESDLEGRGLNPEEYYDELEKGLAEIGARAERRGLDISDVIQGIKSRRQGSVDRQEGRDTIAAEGLAGAPPVATESGPLGAAPIAPVGGGRGLAAANGIAPQEASPMGVPAMPPPTASPMARASGVNAPGYEGIHSRGSRELLARGDIKGGLSRADQARAARSGEEALAAPRTITGELDLAPGFRADEEALTRRGDREGAQAAGAKNITFRHNLALNNLGTLMRDIEMGEMDPDRLAGVSKNAFQNLPETGIDHLQMSEDGSTIDFIYADGREPNSLPNTPEGRAQMVSAFGAYSKDPQTYMNESMAARAKQIADDKELQQGIDKEERTELMGALREHYITNPTKAYETALTAAIKGEGKGGGGTDNSDFKNLQLGPGKSSIVVNGKPVTVEIATEETKWPDHFTKEQRIPGRMIVQLENGQTTDFKSLGLSEKAENNVAAILTQAAAYDASNRDANMQSFLKAARAVFGREGGDVSGGRRGPSESRPPPDAKQIQQDYEDVAKEHGFKTTSITRTAEENAKVGGKENSQHLEERGTARDFSVKDKSPEEIAAFTAAMEAKGYRVIDETDGKTGSGPHLHVQLPPQWKGGSESSPAQKPSAPDAKSPASTANVGPAKKQPTEEEAAAAKAAADAKAVHADERRRAGGNAPKQRSREHAQLREAVEEAESDYKTADSKLKSFDADMREAHGLETSTGMTKLNPDQQAFRQRLVKARDNAEGIQTKAEGAMSRAETSAAQAGAKKSSEAATAALEEKYGNPDTDYVEAGKAKSRSAK